MIRHATAHLDLRSPKVSTPRTRQEQQKQERKPQKKPRWTPEDFSIGTNPLGKGQFGKVYPATEMKFKLKVALKVIQKADVAAPQLAAQTVNELRHHNALTHPNIIGFYGYFHTDDTIYIILERARCSLYDEMKRRPGQRFDEKTAAHCVRDIALALRHCHARGVVHRDLKPENLLIGMDRRVKLGDFGWATRMTDGYVSGKSGTLDFMSPEMCTGIPYGFDADLWALGAVAYEMLVGEPPFMRTEGNLEECRQKTMHSIAIGRFEFPIELKISRMARHFVEALLVQIPQRRMPLASVLVHPWIVSNTRRDE